MHHLNASTLAHIMACHLFGTKPLPESVWFIQYWELNQNEIQLYKIENIHSKLWPGAMWHLGIYCFYWYCQTFNIRCTKSQNLNISRLVLQLSLPNPFKPGVNRSRPTTDWRAHCSVPPLRGVLQSRGECPSFDGHLLLREIPCKLCIKWLPIKISIDDVVATRLPPKMMYL